MKWGYVLHQKLTITNSKEVTLLFMRSLLSPSTLKILHTGHEESLSHAQSIVGAASYLLEYLKKNRSMIVPEDCPTYDVFCSSLTRCIEYRKITDISTDAITFYNITVLYICRWLNVSADVVSRRKSWESDLTKMLENCLEDSSLSSVNPDLFGVRVILNLTEDYGKLYLVHDTVNKILAGTDPCLRNQFLSWARNNVSPLTFPVIESVLAIPLSIIKNKNFVANPKPNGYQSLHTTMQIDSYYATDPKLRGVYFEIQYRTWEMHENAENNPAQSHRFYKTSSIPDDIYSVFTLDDYSKCTIPGVTNEFDEDGVKKKDDRGKQVATRRTLMTS